MIRHPRSAGRFAFRASKPAEREFDTPLELLGAADDTASPTHGSKPGVPPSAGQTGGSQKQARQGQGATEAATEISASVSCVSRHCAPKCRCGRVGGLFPDLAAIGGHLQINARNGRTHHDAISTQAEGFRCHRTRGNPPLTNQGNLRRKLLSQGFK